MAHVPYRYDQFQRELILHDMKFEGGPEPGDPFPDFDLPTTTGNRAARDGLVADRPMLLVFSSFT